MAWHPGNVLIHTLLSTAFFSPPDTAKCMSTRPNTHYAQFAFTKQPTHCQWVCDYNMLKRQCMAFIGLINRLHSFWWHHICGLLYHSNCQHRLSRTQSTCVYISSKVSNWMRILKIQNNWINKGFIEMLLAFSPKETDNHCTSRGITFQMPYYINGRFNTQCQIQSSSGHTVSAVVFFSMQHNWKCDRSRLGISLISLCIYLHERLVLIFQLDIV